MEIPEIDCQINTFAANGPAIEIKVTNKNVRDIFNLDRALRCYTIIRRTNENEGYDFAADLEMKLYPSELLGNPGGVDKLTNLGFITLTKNKDPGSVDHQYFVLFVRSLMNDKTATIPGIAKLRLTNIY